MGRSKLLGWADSNGKSVDELRRALEAVLFVAGDAVSVNQLSQILDCEEDLVRALLDELTLYLEEQGRGVRLRRTVGGYQLASTPEASEYVAKLLRGGPGRPLTNAALEVLAIVAYRQPVTRGEIAALRGVNSDAVINGLIHKNLIKEIGKKPGPGGAATYGTTRVFLERFGLRSLSELPPIEDFAANV